MNVTIPKLAEVRKALAAGVAAVAPLAIADFSGNHWSQADILGLVGAFIGAALLVFGVPNAVSAAVVAKVAPTPKTEAGAVSVATVALVAIAVVLVLAFFGVHGHLG